MILKKKFKENLLAIFSMEREKEKKWALFCIVNEFSLNSASNERMIKAVYI